MKTTVLILCLSSSAFGASRVMRAEGQASVSAQTKAVSQALAQSSKLVATSATPGPSDSASAPAAPTSTLKQRTKMNPTVSASSPGYGTALAKRSPKKSIAVTLPSEPGIKAPTFGDFELKAQFRNTMTLGRAQELQDEGGRNFGLNTEVRVGLKHKSGWGIGVTGTYKTDNFADPSSDTGKDSDASLMLSHPSIFKNNTFDLYGALRIYVPTSESSRENDVRSATYYSFLDITLPKKFSLSNTFLVHGFTRPAPGATDITSAVYESLELSHQTAKGMALAFGAQAEADSFYGQQTGTQVDLYPFIDFTLIPNVLIEPKFYLPVFVSGGGSVGASGASLDQSQAELFIKIAI
jgi:hypothetical protein